MIKKSIKQTNKQTNKQKDKKKKKTKQNKRKENKTKQKKKKKKKRTPSTDLRSTALFFTLQTTLFLLLKWQVAQSFHRARSHDLFWKGVGPHKNSIPFGLKKTFWTYLPRALGLTLLKKHNFWPILWPKKELFADSPGYGPVFHSPTSTTWRGENSLWVTVFLPC